MEPLDINPINSASKKMHVLQTNLGYVILSIGYSMIKVAHIAWLAIVSLRIAACYYILAIKSCDV